MIFIIGGVSAGKLDFARTLGYKDSEIGNDFSFPVVYKLNGIIKNNIDNNINSIDFINEKLLNSTPSVIICDEVGCGVVPMDKKDRLYRETLGKTATIVAQKSDVVYRVYCGIETKIKG